jgi:hypothetical protein
MKVTQTLRKLLAGSSIALAALSVSAQTTKVTLSGSQEVPPVTTAATGSGTITVSGDGSISGSVTTNGVEATMAHIHEAPLGKNGPVIITFDRTASNVWSIPAGTKLSAAQLKSFKSGNLYVNVHSALNKDGEIRGQLRP